MQAAGADAWPAQDVVLISKFFIVAKRISLFLARKWPQMTIDHLVYEISYMLRDEDALPARSAPISQVRTTPPRKNKVKHNVETKVKDNRQVVGNLPLMDGRHICCWAANRLQLCAEVMSCPAMPCPSATCCVGSAACCTMGTLPAQQAPITRSRVLSQARQRAMHHMGGESPCIKLAAELLFFAEVRSGPATHDDRLPGARGQCLLLKKDQ